MLDNLYLVAAVILILWIAGLAYYFRVSRQQRALQQEIEALKAQLDQRPDTEQE